MADQPSSKTENNTNGFPAPEVLQAKTDKAASEASSDSPAVKPAADSPKRPLRRGSYKPSHKATFVGIVVVIAILAVNSIVIAFVLQSQNKKIKNTQGNVVISQQALDKVGVSSSSIGTTGVQLTVNPDARFKGNVAVGQNLSVSGQLILNNKLSAGDSNLAQLNAGNTSVQQLNVNGDATASNLNLRSNLVVAGASQLQGPTTISNLLTVNSNANISGNLSVGGTLSVSTFHSSTLISDYGITEGGHVITEGSAPSVSAGSGLGGTGTVSISGNDISGTVAVNVGATSVNGGVTGAIVANVTFTKAYSDIPHVVVTAVGPGASGVYVICSTTGFSIGVDTLSTGGHAFNYIVEQ